MATRSAMKTGAKASNRGKRLSRGLSGDIFIFTLLIVIGIFMVLPFIYSIVQSLKPMEELFIFPPRLYVVKPTLNNYYSITQLTTNLWIPLSRHIFNSIFVSVLATGGHVILASMAAFPIAKYKFPGSSGMFQIIVLALLFTTQVTAVPSYMIMSKLNLVDTYGAQIFPILAMPLGMFLMKQFMQGIPDANIESAKVDGANTFTIFLKIVMPQVKPAWLTLTILSFQASWNNEGLSYIHSEALKGIPAILKQITASGIARSGAAAAVSVILMVPPLTVFIISQSNVIETMAHSGIKE